MIHIYAIAIVFAVIAAFMNSLAPLLAGLIMCVVGAIVERVGK